MVAPGRGDTCQPTCSGIVLKMRIKEWAESTTCHGIPEIIRSKSTARRLMWVVVILLCLALMIYQLIQTIRDFRQYKWTTRISEELSPDGIELPTITVCNYNRFRRSNVDKYGLDPLLARYIFHQNRNQYVINDRYYGQVPPGEKEFITWRDKMNFTYYDIYDKLGYKCEEVFIRTECKWYNAIEVFNEEFGKCFQLWPNRTTTLPGTYGGVSLIMDTMLDDYMATIFNNYGDEGFALQLSYDGKVERGKWITLSPGFHQLIGMQQRVDKISMKKRAIINPFAYVQSTPPCVENPTLQFDSNEKYSRLTCISECDAMYTIKKCKCIPFIISKVHPTCRVEQIENCVRYSDENLTEEEKTCYASCLDPCNDRKVETTISFSRFPNAQGLNNLTQVLSFLRPGKNITGQYIRENYAMVDIYFQTMHVKMVEMYEVMSVEGLVSTTGGLLSLWAGMSFLTIYQMMIYLVAGSGDDRGRIEQERLEKERKVRAREVRRRAEYRKNTVTTISSATIDNVKWRENFMNNYRQTHTS